MAWKKKFLKKQFFFYFEQLPHKLLHFLGMPTAKYAKDNGATALTGTQKCIEIWEEKNSNEVCLTRRQVSNEIKQKRSNQMNDQWIDSASLLTFSPVSVEKFCKF